MSFKYFLPVEIFNNIFIDFFADIISFMLLFDRILIYITHRCQYFTRIFVIHPTDVEGILCPSS